MKLHTQKSYEAHPVMNMLTADGNLSPIKTIIKNLGIETDAEDEKILACALHDSFVSMRSELDQSQAEKARFKALATFREFSHLLVRGDEEFWINNLIRDEESTRLILSAFPDRQSILPGGEPLNLTPHAGPDFTSKNEFEKKLNSISDPAERTEFYRRNINKIK